jgi:hypothetical protein
MASLVAIKPCISTTGRTVAAAHEQTSAAKIRSETTRIVDEFLRFNKASNKVHHTVTQAFIDTLKFSGVSGHHHYHQAYFFSFHAALRSAASFSRFGPLPPWSMPGRRWEFLL